MLTGKPEGVNNDFGEIHTGYAWEPARQRFCSDIPHTTPIALVVFANKSHLDVHGLLSTLAIIFTLSFFNEKSRNSFVFWGPMAFLPNLNAGSLTSWNSNVKKKDPTIGVQDELDCLCAAFSSLRNIHRDGSIKTTVLGKDVVCKPWIHFVVDDNSGNNQFVISNNPIVTASAGMTKWIIPSHSVNT